MAHSPRAKAQALAMLILGESVTATAAATGIPKQMVSIEQGSHNGLIYEARGTLTTAYGQFAQQIFAPTSAE